MPMMRGLRTRWNSALLLVVFAAYGCANWQPVAISPAPHPVDQRAILEFHVHDQVVRLHGVRFSADSLSGVPWLKHLNCDSCRVQYALADISQPRAGHPGREAWIWLSPVIALFGIALVIGWECRGGRCDS
ncbi:MAG TPA: hypothetical protein VGM20_06130 [Gemmatimonadales bacterium]|jgi:hypothetical protein